MMLGLWLDAPKCRNFTVTRIIGEIGGPYSTNQENNKMFYIPLIYKIKNWTCQLFHHVVSLLIMGTLLEDVIQPI